MEVGPPRWWQLKHYINSHTYCKGPDPHDVNFITVNSNRSCNENEGNFIAMLRLLSKNNATLHEHLTFGAKNAKYTSKTIQNEILGIAADQIRGFYRSCLHHCSHFSLITDEVTSHGKEILSVFLQFLEIDHNNFYVKPVKHEVLLDFRFLERITGQCIAENIFTCSGVA